MKAYEDSRVDSLDDLARDINLWAAGKGFNDIPPALDRLCKASLEVDSYVTAAVKGQKIALFHSEASELLEGLRSKHNTLIEVDAQLSNEEEELADLIIRALHYAGQYGLRIGKAVQMKMAKNEARPHKHGKEF